MAADSDDNRIEECPDGSDKAQIHILGGRERFHPVAGRPVDCSPVTQVMSTGPIMEYYTVLSCPHCWAFAAVVRTPPSEELAFRAYMDGALNLPWSYNTPIIARCATCDRSYWCDDGIAIHAKSSSDLTDAEYATAIESANWLEDPGEHEVYSAIRDGLAKSSEQEICLRLLAWHRRNDAYRYPEQNETTQTPPMLNDCRVNLVTLFNILDNDDPLHFLLKCEVLRECGEFDIARTLLTSLTHPELVRHVAIMQELCIARDVRVRQYPWEEHRVWKRAQ